MYFEDEIQLPALIPIRIKKKKKDDEDVDREDKPEISNDIINILAREFDKQKEEKEQKKIEKNTKPSIGPEKIEEIDRKFHNLQEKGSSKKQQKSGRLNNYKQRENQKSKHIITDLMKKIDAKNIAEELYPITNEAILGFIKQVDKEVEDLKVDAERKENSLITNPNNQHLKKELQTLKVSIDRCVTIKQLYNEKINLRNKVSILERNIIKLKEQNQNLSIKNYREGDDQQNHSNGLPCYRERQLKDELTKCQHEFNKQKGMREKLENNINDIVQNFKRLYEEADTARLVVTRKLKEIQEKQKAMMYEQSLHESEKDAASEKKTSPKLDVTDMNKRTKTMTNNDLDANKTPRKGGNYLHNTDVRSKQPDKSFQRTTALEDQILKMRGNQSTMAKTNYKR